MALRDVTNPVLVTIHRWRHPVYGDRWTLVADDRAIITRGTELEARRYAKDAGWVVARTASE